MITYEWTSLNLQVRRQLDDLKDTIVSILWAYTCADGDLSVFDTGRCEMAAPDPLNYIPFDQITKEILVGWLEDNLDINQLQEQLAARLEIKRQEDLYLVQFTARVPNA